MFVNSIVDNVFSPCMLHRNVIGAPSFRLYSECYAGGGQEFFAYPYQAGSNSHARTRRFCTLSNLGFSCVMYVRWHAVVTGTSIYCQSDVDTASLRRGLGRLPFPILLANSAAESSAKSFHPIYALAFDELVDGSRSSRIL